MRHMPTAELAPSREDMQLAAAAIRFMDLVKQAIRTVGEDLGLSIAQLDVLRQLRAHGPTPMRRLAATMHCEASNLTGLVDKLERRGLVQRQEDPADRRVRVLALTDEGTEVSYQVWATVTSRCPFMNLPADDRAQLDRLLRQSVSTPDPAPEATKR
jgi:DNA-binding MarR family transcriptional regulator